MRLVVYAEDNPPRLRWLIVKVKEVAFWSTGMLEDYHSLAPLVITLLSCSDWSLIPSSVGGRAHIKHLFVLHGGLSTCVGVHVFVNQR